MVFGTLFHWTREPEGNWLTRLRQITPVTRQTEWLRLVWMPGELYQPVQRWVLYLMTPRLDRCPEHLLEQLEGPDPRTLGRWVRDAGYPDGRRWHSEVEISRMQWLLYRQTRGMGTGWRAWLEPGCFPKLYWIIQGSEGGHKWKLSPTERQMLRLRGLDRDVPAPGDLPYVEPDERVWSMIETMDRLRDRQFRMRIDQQNRGRLTNAEAGRLVRQERAKEEQQFRWELNAWLERQVKQGLEQTKLPFSTSDLPEGDRRYDHDREEQLRSFIEDTPSAE